MVWNMFDRTHLSICQMWSCLMLVISSLCPSSQNMWSFGQGHGIDSMADCTVGVQAMKEAVGEAHVSGHQEEDLKLTVDVLRVSHSALLQTENRPHTTRLIQFAYLSDMSLCIWVSLWSKKLIVSQVVFLLIFRRLATSKPLHAWSSKSAGVWNKDSVKSFPCFCDTRKCAANVTHGEICGWTSSREACFQHLSQGRWGYQMKSETKLEKVMQKSRMREKSR